MLRAPTAPAITAVVAWAVSGVTLVGWRLYAPGAACWLLAAVAAWRSGSPAVRRRVGVLLASVAVLAVAPINTDTATVHFVTMGLVLLAVVAGPSLLFALTDPAVIRYKWLSRQSWRWQVGYVLLAIPVAWLGLRAYFFLSPEIEAHWPLPAAPEREALWRLFLGINGVGIWEELFFINVAFATLRTVAPIFLANLAQASLYTTVLVHMAFTGWGPAFIFPFALAQGWMFQRSHSLLTVILVHLIVDWFLFDEIVTAHYPGTAPLALLFGG
jgi:membrane protease YdiL (CAAX protease family)